MKRHEADAVSLVFGLIFVVTSRFGWGLLLQLGEYVDRILDMSRTALNVTGDFTAAAYVARTEAGWDPKTAEAETARQRVGSEPGGEAGRSAASQSGACHTPSSVAGSRSAKPGTSVLTSV